MATITNPITNVPYVYDFTEDGYVEFGSYLTQTANQFSWETTGYSAPNGFQVEAEVRVNGNFTYNNGVPSGSVTSIELYNITNGNEVLTITYASPILFDVSLLVSSPARFWERALTQNDTIQLTGLGSIKLAGDFQTVINAWALSGDDDIVTLSGPNKVFAGDAATVEGGLSGGDDIINVIAQPGQSGNGVLVAGDAFEADGGTVTGGDDIISSTTGSATTLIGDVQFVRNLSTVNAGNDTITSGNAGDIIYGDVQTIEDAASVVNAGNDTIHGGGGNDFIYGDYLFNSAGATVTGGYDTIYGEGGNDQIFGQVGNDYIDGGAGNDVMNGGDGTDTVSYATATSGVTVDLSITTQQNTIGAGLDTISNFENLTGSDFDDILTGDSGNNTINGGDGDDIIDAGFGDDIVHGGEGNDRIYRDADGTPNNQYYGGGGIDTLVSSGLGSSITMDLAAGEMRNSAGLVFDIIDGFENYEGGGSEAVIGTSGDNRITMSANNGHNVIDAGAGNDIVEGGGGNDTIDGGADTDTASYASAGTGVTVSLALQGSQQNTIGAGLDTLTNFENLLGSAHNDSLTGDAGENTLEGGAGDDILNGGDGDDRLDGGADHDTAVFNAAFANFMFASIGSDTDFGVSDTVGAGGTDALIDIEIVQFTDQAIAVQRGTGGGETLIGNANGNIILGLDGNDIINGAAGNDGLYGGAGDDDLVGGAGADLLDGGTNTAITGQAQAGIGDTATYSNSSAAVFVNLQAGTASGGHAEGDILHGIENLLGSIHADTLTGDDNANYIDGFNGDDTLVGNGGDDYLNGGNGDDTLIGGAGADFLNGGSGMGDVADYSASDAGVNAGVNAGAVNTGGHAEGDTLWVEHITGSDHDDNIIGNSVQNILIGGDGDDYLNGGDNTDELYGGSGDDYLIGGNGADIIDGGTNTAVGDTAAYVNAGARIVANLNTNTVTFSGNGAGDTLIGIENITGSLHDDFIYGDNNANTLDGFGGHDYIVGGGGNDTLIGGGGDDILDGGTGNDTFTGGSGIDTYDFNVFDFGQDTITDWQNGSDKLDFSTLNLDFDDFTISQSGADTLIVYDFDPNQFLTLLNTNAALIDASDFV